MHRAAPSAKVKPTRFGVRRPELPHGNANRNFRFDLRYRAITGATRAEVVKQVENGFPLLPAGCSMQLDRVARQVVLENLKEAIGSRFATLVREAIEEALGAEAEGVLPEAVRLIDLHVRLPRHQVAMLAAFAEREQTSVSDVLARELDGVACAHADELSWAVVGFGEALLWPEGAAGAAN